MDAANESLSAATVLSKIKDRARECERETDFIELAISAAMEVGEASEKVAPGSTSELRARVQKLSEMKHERDGEVYALRALERDYACSAASEFDFERYMMKKRQQYAAKTPMDVLMVEAFDAACRRGTEELDPDAELMVVGAGADGANGVKNAKCPLCLRKVEDLDEPVEDLKGFVYEQAAILEYIGRKPSVPCPVAGTSHAVKKADLKPSRAAIRLKARRGRFASEQVATSQYVSP